MSDKNMVLAGRGEASQQRHQLAASAVVSVHLPLQLKLMSPNQWHRELCRGQMMMSSAVSNMFARHCLVQTV